MRVYLTVPYEQKDAAKEKGARWDHERRLWYVPDGLDAMRFLDWLPPEWRKYNERLKEKRRERRRNSKALKRMLAVASELPV